MPGTSRPLLRGFARIALLAAPWLLHAAPAADVTNPAPNPTLPVDTGTRTGVVLSSPADVEGLLAHALQLQQQILKAQKNLLYVLEDEWVQIVARGGKTSPERAAQVGLEVKGHLRLMNALQGQLTSTFFHLRATDPDTWPPGPKLRYQDQERAITEGRRSLEEGMAGLVEHLDLSGYGEAGDLPPVEPGTGESTSAGGVGGNGGGGDGGSSPAVEEEPDAPEELEAVGQRILTGRVATPADVVSVFERLPEAPVGSLDELRRHAEE